MAKSNGSVKVINSALDEFGAEKEIIVRGVIDNATLRQIQIGEYQREILPMAKIRSLIEAMKTGSVPDIELGMRGHNSISRNDAVFLQDPVFVIDGLQRITAALQMLQEGGTPHLGATVHFGTTEEWERERFRILNMDRSKLSPNIHLRNFRHDYAVVEALYGLCRQDMFVLGQRVCWSQRMKREDLLTAMTLIQVAGVLHSRFGAGKGNRVPELVRAVDGTMDKVGKTVFVENLVTFFGIVDECWGVRVVTFKDGATHLRSNFLLTLADIMTRQNVFWRGKKLFVDRDIRRKLAQFPMTDPHVKELCSSGSSARKILYHLLIEHVNRGKRTKRLDTGA